MRVNATENGALFLESAEPMPSLTTGLVHLTSGKAFDLDASNPFASAIATILGQKLGRLDVAGRTQKIRAAVVQEAAEFGYLDSNMTRIARRARVSTATLYKLFQSKIELFSDAQKLAIPLLQAILTKEFDHPDPFARMTAKLAHHGTALNRRFLPWFYYRFDRVLPEADKVRQSARLLQLNSAFAQAIEDHWVEQLSQLVEQGYLLPTIPCTMPNLLLGVMDRHAFLTGIEFQSTRTRDLTIEDFARATMEMLFAAYGTQHYKSCKEAGQWAPLSP